MYVFQPVDYDSMLTPFFNLTVYVQDSNPGHTDQAYIEIDVSDYNDNAPVFLPNMHSFNMFENETVGTSLVKFRATDSDMGVNKEFT